MFGLRVNRLALGACGMLLVGVVVSCGTSSDSPGDTAKSPTTPLPAISEIIFSGDLKKMETVPGKGNTVNAVTGGTVPAVSLSSKGPKREPDGDGDSGIVRLTPTLSTELAGRTVTVSITLRTAPKNGSPSVKAMYSRPGVASSGWRDLPAKTEFATVTFEYAVPAQAGPRGPDLVSIWADPEGRDRAVEIRSVEINSTR